MKIEEITGRGAQGDMILQRVDCVPDGYVPVAAQNGTHTLAHSETGHNHDTQALGVTFFQSPDDPMVCYLRLESVEHADIVHHRSFDTHGTLRLLGGPDSVWKISRQREYSVMGDRRVED